MNFSKLLKKSYVNYRGWTTNQKIVVIESDDWGSVRIADKRSLDEMISKGLPLQKTRYTSLDSLENKDDLRALFEILRSHKGIDGNYACLTANSVLANPNFTAMKNNNYSSYLSEPLQETYERLRGGQEMSQLWNEGIQNNLFYPQFHGKEHIHPQRWLEAGRQSIFEKIGTDFNSILGIPLGDTKRIEYLAACNYYHLDEKPGIEIAVREGLDMFEKMFGFRSKSFIAPQSIRSSSLNKMLNECGVKYHQNGQQILPTFESTTNNIVNNYWGDYDQFGLLHWRRNVTFEPSKDPNADWIKNALEEIKVAFMFGKPAVINSHRVNYIGSLSKDNRDRSLDLLNQLLGKIIKKWPNVIFVNSEQLGDIIFTDK